MQLSLLRSNAFRQKSGEGLQPYFRAKELGIIRNVDFAEGILCPLSLGPGALGTEAFVLGVNASMYVRQGWY